MAYNFNVILQPYSDAYPGKVFVDTNARYGFWEYRDGEEGGELLFSLNSEGKLELIDYDGAYELPSQVCDALYGAGFIVTEEFYPDSYPHPSARLNAEEFRYII